MRKIQLRYGLGVFATQWHAVSDDFVQALFEHARQARPIFRVVQLAFEWIDVDRKPPLFPEAALGVFITRQDVSRIQIQSLGEIVHKKPDTVANSATPKIQPPNRSDVPARFLRAFPFNHFL